MIARALKKKKAVKQIAKILLIALLLSIDRPVLYSQYYIHGQEPGHLKWQKIETPYFQVIFPEGKGALGKRVAGLLDQAYMDVSWSLQHEPKKVSILLHVHSSTSLAFVGWAPSRSEWFTTPHQSLSSMGWLETLALHETRHIVQMSKIESEMPRALRLLFGEQAGISIMGLYLPFWFIEGDAVCVETGLSPAGSGRTPEFFMGPRAEIVCDGPYSYNKAYLGSYKDYIPSYYQMGYLMTGGTRYLYNKLAWDSVVAHVANKPFSMVAFEQGIKKSTGLGQKELYNKVYKHFQETWKQQDEQLALSPFQKISPGKTIFTHYVEGAKMENGTYLALKQSLKEIEQLVSFSPGGKEKRVLCIGPGHGQIFSAKDSLVAWIKKIPHPRWVFQDYSKICLYNLNSGKQKTFKQKGKFYAPALSPDNKKIAYVEVDGFYKTRLKIMDVQTGKLSWQYTMPAYQTLITPSWASDGQSIYYTVLHDQEKGIVNIDLASWEIDTLLPFSTNEIKYPLEHGDWIYYLAGYTGINNLFAVNKHTGHVYQKTSSRFGVGSPSIKGNEMIYSDYNKDGYRLVRIPLDSLWHVPFDINSLPSPYPVAEKLSRQEGGQVSFHNLQEKSYKIEKYSKFKNLINVHS